MDRVAVHRARRRPSVSVPARIGVGDLIDPLSGPGERSPLTRRWLGVPLLFAVAYSAIGFSLYFALGLVAERGLGLTPLIFLGVGVIFILNALTYVEGEAMLPERGGSSTFARRAFNELVSFIAGWAILIDFVIVIALAALSVPHYLTPIWSGFSDTAPEIATAGLVIALVAVLAVGGFTGAGRQRLLTVVAVAGVGLLLAVIVVGLITSFDLTVLTTDLDPFDSFANPSLEDAIYAGVIATVAFAGIEAAANLAPEVRRATPDLRKLLVVAVSLVPLLYFGVAVVALMAVPVTATPDGPQTALGSNYIEDPVLGVVQSFDPAWLSDAMQAGVVVVAPLALIWAANAAMLGLSRHVYVLATNRQIPSWLGKLNRPFQTPHIAIAVAAVLAFALVLPTDIALLGGLFAFGATIAFTIAHLSIVRLRITEPNLERPFRIPFNVSLRGGRVPLPALIAALLTALAWVSVIAYHDTARWVGAGWMVFGLLAYVVYRKGFEGTTLTARVEVPAEALVGDVGEAEYGDILVPVFGTTLDDDIVGTAGRLADAAELPGKSAPRLEVIYVAALPLTVPLDSPPPPEVAELANAALERAQQVGEEYETVEVHPSVVRARTVGAGIVQAARDRKVEVIVMGGEPPTRVRGGAVLGGVGGSRPEEIGPVTEYVLRRAPCRVLITAPPGDGPPPPAEAAEETGRVRGEAASGL
ncbi:MAG: amino acid permease [Solirubrobacterales bacterium]|nr:amino acid permease [Solirubrobacterales bacterium]